jgi:hypothetical protein
MTAKRNLFLAAACAVVLGGAATAQTPLVVGRTPTPAARTTGSGPTVAVTGAPLPLIPPATGTPSPTPTTTQVPIPAYQPETVATDVLTAPQGGVPMVPGAVCSPWNGAGVGGNGPITYEGYVRTGPSLNIGGGELSAILDHGWMTAVGGRTLFFNETNDAAWVLDLGLSYTENLGPRLGRITRVTALELKGAGGERGTDPNTPTLFPDVTFLMPAGVRKVRRTSLNFGVGRDWWLYGPGTVEANGGSGASNWRGGVDVGGRWGTASIDLEPQFDTDGVRRRQGVYHGVYVGSSLNWEKQFGGVILQAGVRGEWGYDWMNLLPPQNSDLHSLNILMTFGLRY